ncbi:MULTISPECIES: hypothetical protein [unclassified Bradyrhizobium]|nr:MULTISPECIES: hypothetical protein [unclassified Bradyrhizobium]
MEATIGLNIGPIDITGTGLSGTGAAVVIVIAIIVYLIKARPSIKLI